MTFLTRNNLGLYNSGTYEPANEYITNITQANPCVVTTSVSHSFVIGNQVQFTIPPQWGMLQLDGLKGYIIAIPVANQITVEIDTSTFNAFVIPTPPPSVVYQSAQVAPVGDQNFGNLSPGGIPILPITVPGAYINVFP